MVPEPAVLVLEIIEPEANRRSVSAVFRKFYFTVFHSFSRLHPASLRRFLTDLARFHGFPAVPVWKRLEPMVPARFRFLNFGT